MESVQWLRAVAALMVVTGHTAQMMGARLSFEPSSPLSYFDVVGGTGVDIFFVISGFIMLHTTWKSGTHRSIVYMFWLRRLIRIVPMYWLATSAMLLILLSGLASEGLNRPIQDVVRSYLFLPLLDETGKLRPLLGVGWTLIYEMFFYFCFGLALFIRHPIRILAVFAALLMLMATGQFIPELRGNVVFFAYSDPLLTEFLLGVGIGFLYRQYPSTVVPIWLSVAVHLLSWLALSLTAYSLDGAPLTRPLLQGLPAAGVVWSALAVERHFGGWARVPVLSTLGDASYSLYLIHPILLSGFSFLSRPLRHTELAFPAIVLAAITVIISIIAILSYRLVERPLGKYLSQRFLRRPEHPPAHETTLGHVTSGSLH